MKRPYEVGLQKRIQDPNYAQEYLNCARKESPEALAEAYRHVRRDAENQRMRELLLAFKRNVENVLEEERTGFEVAHLREIESFLADPKA